MGRAVKVKSVAIQGPKLARTVTAIESLTRNQLPCCFLSALEVESDVRHLCVATSLGPSHNPFYIPRMAVLSFNSLPLGFRFRPTDEELITHYLRLKISGNDEEVRVIREIDVCKWEPWDLPDLSEIRTNDMEWFFFCPRDRKYPNGHRLNRATAAGYWKATGRDRQIKSKTRLVGMKKNSGFPYWASSSWEEDRLGNARAAFVLCRLFKKQDEKAEGSNPDEIEPTVPSPTPANSPEETEFEVALPQVAPVEKQEEEQPGFAEGCPGENPDEMTAESSVPVGFCSNPLNAYDEEDPLAKLTAAEVDPSLQEDFGFSQDQMLEQLDYQLFSPVHSQWHMGFESYVSYPVTGNFSNGHNGENEYGTHEQDPDVTEFLESVLKENGSCSESDTVSQTQLDVEFDASAVIIDNIKTEALQEMETNISAFNTTTGNSAVEYSGNMGFSHNNFGDDAFSVVLLSTKKDTATTNSIRCNNCGPQGTARRRIRLQTKLEVRHACSMSRDLNCKEEAEVRSGQASQSDTSGTTDENQKIEVKKVDQELKMSMSLLRFRSKYNVLMGSDKKGSIRVLKGSGSSCMSPNCLVCFFA
ncbi:NAC domain-containing protein 91 [Vitis vinifera]|uniref:NAC domain-containing protein 91 n=1 Tax=Vitis vinifera TaxID=29760 RepID=A0A438FLN0_VITVI|nr:NAC domain-containing protein 91 [Vitis vinifera]